MTLSLLRLHFVVLNKIRVFVLLYGCSRKKEHQPRVCFETTYLYQSEKIKKIYLIKQNQTPQIMNL